MEDLERKGQYDIIYKKVINTAWKVVFKIIKFKEKIARKNIRMKK